MIQDKRLIASLRKKALENLGYISEPATLISSIRDIMEIIEMADRMIGPDAEAMTAQVQNMGSEDKARTSDNMKRKPEKKEAAEPVNQEKKTEVVSSGWTDQLRQEAAPCYEYLGTIAAQPGGVEWLNNQLSMFTSGLYQNYMDQEMPPQTFKAWFDSIVAIINEMQQQQSA